jgi:hypothetical protein
MSACLESRSLRGTRRPSALVAAVVLLLAAAVPVAAVVAWTNTKARPASFVTHQLVAPTTLSATGGASVTLSWPITTDTYASGYHVERGTVSGGPYALVGTVASRTTLTYTETPAASGIYYYVVRSFYGVWESPNTPQATAVVTLPATWTSRLYCASQAADTGGDGNGYETNPTRACGAPDAASATDANSGTNAATLCTNTGKDNHRFYDYSFSLPGTVVSINGIELQAVAGVSTTTGTSLCAQLSWDGGLTWTTNKSMPFTATGLTTYTFGGVADTWGRAPGAWGVGNFTNANLRLRITDVANNKTQTFSLDAVGIRINYTP